MKYLIIGSICVVISGSIGYYIGQIHSYKQFKNWLGKDYNIWRNN